ncbi:MAG: hypothetical protein RSE64_08225 [Oscillospiraceae bacterium]
MEITVKADAEEIAALVVELQERQRRELVSVEGATKEIQASLISAFDKTV